MLHDPDPNTLLGRLMIYLESASAYLLVNLAWVVLVVPIIALFFGIFNLFTEVQTYPWPLVIIPLTLASPITAGLYFVTNQLAHEKGGGLAVFWEGIKSYILPSYLWGFMNMIMIFLISLNVWFYSNLEWEFAPYLMAAFVVIAVFWLAMQLYTFPFIIEQEKPSIRTALRNSFVVTARYPLQTFGMLILIAAIAGVSTFAFWPLWLFISAALITYLSSKLTIYVLGKLEEKIEAEKTKNTD